MNADQSDKPVAFRMLRHCRWAADKLLLPLRARFVLNLEKIARSPWRYHDGVSPGRRPERQHPEEHCRWGRETHVTMIECEAGHTRPDARATRAQRALLTVPINSVLLPGRLHRPVSHGLRPSPPSVTSPSARSRTHTHGSQGGTDSQTQSPENATGQTLRLIST